MDTPTKDRGPAAVTTPVRRGLGHRLWANTKAFGANAGRRWDGLTLWRKIGLIAGFVLILAGLYLWRQQADRLAGLTTATVTYGDIEDSVTALGNLQPLNYVDVGAQVSGQLDKLHVDIGDEVKEGDLLAEIDAQVQTARVAADEAQLANVKAQLADKQAQLLLATAQFERQKRLKADNATSTDAYQSAQSAAQSAQAQVDALTAQSLQQDSTLKADQVTLGYSKIFAPMSGTIASLTARQGQTLNANQQAPILLQIADLTKMTVWTQVSEADIVRLKPGMEAYFMTLGTPDKRWTGQLRQIQPTPTVTNNVVLYTALFDVDNPKRELMTQMSAQVFFVIASAKHVLTVPVAALKPAPRAGAGNKRDGQKREGQKREGQKTANPATDEAQPGKPYRVTVIGAAGTLSQRMVRVGVANRISAEILSGLEEGETVVTGRKSQTNPNKPAARPLGTPGGIRVGGGMRGP